jgi:TM2 domain-containing membrane protein YozV
MAEKTKAEITEELKAEYRDAMKRTADDEHAQKRKGAFGREGKSIRVAYLLWTFAGAFGGHRFYLGRPFSGACMLALTVVSGALSTTPLLSLFGFLLGGIASVWWVVDAFQIPKMLP